MVCIFLVECIFRPDDDDDYSTNFTFRSKSCTVCGGEGKRERSTVNIYRTLYYKPSPVALARIWYEFWRDWEGQAEVLWNLCIVSLSLPHRRRKPPEPANTAVRRWWTPSSPHANVHTSTHGKFDVRYGSRLNPPMPPLTHLSQSRPHKSMCFSRKTPLYTTTATDYIYTCPASVCLYGFSGRRQKEKKKVLKKYKKKKRAKLDMIFFGRDVPVANDPTTTTTYIFLYIFS